MSLIGKKVKSLKGQTKNMIGTITDDYGEYVYVNFPDRAQKGKNTEVSVKLSDLEIIKEIKMKRNTELKLRKLIERIIRESTMDGYHNKDLDDYSVGDLVGNTVWGFDFEVLKIDRDKVTIKNVKTGETKVVYKDSVYKGKHQRR